MLAGVCALRASVWMGRPDWPLLSRRRYCGGEALHPVPRGAPSPVGCGHEMTVRQRSADGAEANCLCSYIRRPLVLMKSEIVTASRSSTMVTSPLATLIPAT